MISALIAVAGIAAQHQIDSLAIDYRSGWQIVWVENGQTWVANRAGDLGFVLDANGVRMAVDSMRLDTVFRDSFGG